MNSAADVLRAECVDRMKSFTQRASTISSALTVMQGDADWMSCEAAGCERRAEAYIRYKVARAGFHYCSRHVGEWVRDAAHRCELEGLRASEIQLVLGWTPFYTYPDGSDVCYDDGVGRAGMWVGRVVDQTPLGVLVRDHGDPILLPPGSFEQMNEPDREEWAS